MSTKTTRAACGVRVVASTLSTEEAVSAARAELADGVFQHIIVFFSIKHDPEVLLKALQQNFPDVTVSGCSTAGEVGPLGMTQGGIVFIAFPEKGFRVMSEVIPDIDKGGVERASEIARRLRVQMITGVSRAAKENIFALVLVDGLSDREEPLTAALHWSLEDMELLGGSAGDGLAFQRTALIHRGKLIRGGAILFVIETSTPFRVFKTQNFEPTPIKLVVTAADSEHRIVYDLNAEPAASEYASAIGVSLDDLGPLSFATYPLVVKVGGEYYGRAIRNMNPDGSLSFLCAIDEGLVFTVGRPRDMVQSTLETFKQVDAALGGIDFVLGFDCFLRRIDAETGQLRHKVEEIYDRYGLAGFQTYGEQFNAMHLNQTLTGIAFSKPHGRIEPP
ncbi:FIST N-terminal domain-containing protein [Hyphomicrobium sp. DY-1]|uniref:FIST N-terminal domain-containing protein n=1 Tax=Hyphomicrobium sp. DY-1 TaxID=3075650 RepID=UPI0039C3FE18